MSILPQNGPLCLWRPGYSRTWKGRWKYGLQLPNPTYATAVKTTECFCVAHPRQEQYINARHWRSAGADLRRGGGARAPPDSLVAPTPDSKASWPFWRDFWGPKMQIFRGSTPDPAEGAYSDPSDPLADGQGACCSPPKNPTPALGLSGLVSTGLRVSRVNPLQNWQQ